MQRTFVKGPEQGNEATHFQLTDQLRNRSFSAWNPRGGSLCGVLHPRFSPPLLRQGLDGGGFESLLVLGAAAFVLFSCSHPTHTMAVGVITTKVFYFLCLNWQDSMAMLSVRTQFFPYKNPGRFFRGFYLNRFYLFFLRSARLARRSAFVSRRL